MPALSTLDTTRSFPDVISGALPGGQHTSPLDEQSAERTLPFSSYTISGSSTLPIASSSGWGYDDWIGELSSSQHEVTRLNAFFSGTEPIDAAASRDLFYAKTNLLDYFVSKHVLSASDLFLPLPETAPIQSYVVASSTVIGTPLGYRDVLGGMSGSISSGSSWPSSVVVTGWQSYVSASQVGTLLTASQANVLFFGTGSDDFVYVNSVAIAGNTATFSVDASVLPTGSGTAHHAYSAGTSVQLFSWLPLVSAVSGVFRNNTVYSPAQVNVSVTSSGKIRDVRAWVELVHDRRSVLASDADQGLQALHISLRSPNSLFRSANPIWNATNLDRFLIRTSTTLTGVLNRFGDLYRGIPELLRSSYLLWDGHRCNRGLQDALVDSDISASYHEFDRDIDMRTVFWDGSPVNNPRDISALFPSASMTGTGTPRPYQDLVDTITGLYKFYQSPTSGAIFGNVYSSAPAGLGTGSLSCSNFPWMLDDRIDPGAFSGTSYLQDVGMIPPGWHAIKQGGIGTWAISANSSSIGAFARVFVRPSTKKVYTCGGHDVSSVLSSAIVSASYSVVRSSASITSPSVSAGSMPIPLEGHTVDYVSGSFGERVYLVGGSIVPVLVTASSAVYVGEFDVDGLISWTTSTVLPTGVAYHSTVVYSGSIYVFGGNSGTTTFQPLFPIVGNERSGVSNIVQIGTIDQVTGDITGWSVVSGVFPTGTEGHSTLLDIWTDATGTVVPIVHAFSGSYDTDSNEYLQTKIAGGTVLPFTHVGTFNFSPSGSLTSNQVCPATSVGHVIYVPNRIQINYEPPEYSVFFSSSFDVNTLSASLGPLQLGAPAIAPEGKAGQPFIGSSCVPDPSLGMIFFGGNDVSSSFSSNSTEASHIFISAPASDEFATYGRQVGPATIRPVYPLLSDVYATKIFDQTPSVTGALQVFLSRGQTTGVRPGLRGTEVNGTWQFLFGAAEKNFDTELGAQADDAAGVWVRQVRLEFVSNIGNPIVEFSPSRGRLYSRFSNVPYPEGYNRIAILSGSSEWDVGLLYSKDLTFPEYGRSVSITADQNSVSDSFAVLVFITGALAARLSASGVTDLSWFLNGNQFGTPYIPDSSMSLGTGSAEQVDVSASQELLRQTVGIQTLVPNANDLNSFLSRQGYAKTTLQRWEEAIAALSSTSSVL